MNEDALRALVRETIARVQSRGDLPGGGAPQLLDVISLASHPSNYQYNLPPSDGPCIIEPGVPCNHCGYCQTHGH
ncbi:MAG TPA: hypothetical protein VN716_20255 [Vicinamibacterales bacterium]|jgi:hypothetical protein|nr:hypothetical protein [Vicinamibacterales bacterium]HXT31649.1 hypothetical protein [Vicinamibacterales bacterium]